MLSEDEKQELRSLSQSSTVREEFRQLRMASRLGPDGPVNVDNLLSFLNTMARLSTVKVRPKPFVPYTIVRI